MATGRIGVTPNLRTRWSKAPAGGTTSLSGLDDNSVSLVYDAGFEAVYRNGVLLSRGNDYTATNGTTITLIDATIAGDIIEVFANQAIPLTSTYTQAVADAKFINNSLVDAKGDIIAATAADTVARLAVGSNDQVLTADSSTATGLKWATPAAGGMTLLSTTTLSGGATTVSGISTGYNHLWVQLYEATNNTANGAVLFDPNGNGGATRYFFRGLNSAAGTSSGDQASLDRIVPTYPENSSRTNTANYWDFFIYNYSSTVSNKTINWDGYYYSTNSRYVILSGYGVFFSTDAITSVTVQNTGGTWSGGTIKVWGIK